MVNAVEYKLSRTSIFLVFFLVATNSMSYEESAQITFNSRNESIINLLLEYVPAYGINEIYLTGEASIQITRLLADGKYVSNIGWDEYWVARTEVFDMNSVIERLLTVYRTDKFWRLTTADYRKVSTMRLFDIPPGTKELELYYNIVYPKDEASKEFYSKITIPKWDGYNRKIMEKYVFPGLFIFGVFVIYFFASYFILTAKTKRR